jgi:acetoin:2,6-dichlorophenolindophenol oxidoreductase subunit beta
MAKQRIIQAINDALMEEMARDPKVILFGEDVEISLFGDTRGLHSRFGPARVRNTPISENLLTGMAVGAAAAGYRVIAHLMFGNFIHTGFDAIANQAAKLRFMTGGQIRLPITYMAVYGGGKSVAAQHSDTPYPQLMNLGGINVVVPSSPADAKGLLKAAIRCDNPTFFLQAGGRGGEQGEVPEQDYVTPLGQADVKRIGTDATIVAIGAMVRPALRAAESLEKESGLSIEVIDPRTLVPLDEATILGSVAKTGRLVVADEARDRCSAASHIAAVVCDKGFASLVSPVKRVTVPDVAMPYAPSLEKAVFPDAQKIADAVRQVVQYRRS